MLRATLCLVLQWLAPPESDGSRGYAGATEVLAPEGEPNAETAAAAPELAPVPAPVSAPGTPAGSSEPGAPAGSSKPGASAASSEPPRPKWWGPFPRPKLSGFGGPVVQLSGLDRNFAAMIGLAGGLMIKRRVAIGAAAMWLINPSKAGVTSVGAPQQLNFNFGGLLLAVVFARTKTIDFTAGGIVGGGGACLQNPNNGTCYARTAMFVGQPEVAAHIKLAPIVRLTLGLGYRFVVARAWTGPSGARLGAPVGSVMLEFGLF